MIFHSAFESIYLWLPVVGFIVGLIGTLIGGGGGGFFFIPILTILFGVPAQVAVPTSLAATLPICFIGSIGHYRHKNIDLRLGMLMASAGILGALAGAGFTRLVTHRQLIICYGSYAILISILMLRGIRKQQLEKSNGIEKSEDSYLKKTVKGTLFGFLAGVITATFGTTGATPAQAGLFAMRKPVKVVIGTSLLVVMFNTASALVAHFLIGKIDLTLVYFLTAGTIIGSLVGPRVLKDVRLERVDGPIRLWYALGMILFGVIMIISTFDVISTIE
ncbi:MAG: sulfite exporter TauE/SafE family protein [Bacteroidales bacterium]|nr:sulfite exporter TauE/SafE family protein [Bacteroidales bacterium]